jgi:shikimate kinase
MPDDRDVVVLVGMMGSGKSTVGQLLAERLGREFCDTDEEVIRRSGTTIAEIFARDGEDVFRDLESAALVACVDRGGVVATGGGIVLRAANRAVLGGVRVAWLDGSVSSLDARLAGDDSRPLLGTDRVEALTVLDRQRRGWYAEVSSVRIDTTARTPRQVCDELVAWLEGAS